MRWELSEGPGGARLALTHLLPVSQIDRRPTFLAAWQTRHELLADHHRSQIRCPWPEDLTEELRKHQAAPAG